ncbi:MAG TPA: uroporphyrinogen-III synthase [Thermoanaerobaculia bacterium]|nr:uroporphyrinogen-III synthase [Thermoanaerobaculia bacterium]
MTSLESAPTPAPLAGLRVVVTRAAHQAGGLAERFAAAGARIELLPLLEVVPPADPRRLERAASELPLYDWVVFTSANAVEALLPLAGGPLPARVRTAAVGPATAKALRAWQVEPDLTATLDAEGLLALLAPQVGRQRRVLLPQAADARPRLAEGLALAGAEVVTVAAYDKRLPPDAAARAAALFVAADPLGWVTFTSPRVARHFAGLFGDRWERRRPTLRAASIGPVTTAALRRLGAEPAAEARSPRDAELVAAVVRAVLAAS